MVEGIECVEPQFKAGFSTMVKRLESDRSALICPGARIALRDELPK